MREFVRDALVQGFVSAGVVGALLRAWRIKDPGLRVRLRFLVLIAPILLPPLFEAAAPWRHDGRFRSQGALLDTALWGQVPVLGFGLDLIVVAACVVAGGALFLRDAVPLVFRGSETSGPARLPAGEVAKDVRSRATAIARSLSIDPPAVEFLPHDGAALMCSGLTRPAIRLSGRLTQLLDEQELDAALAHEMAHVAYRHTAFGWLLMGLRSLLFFHPAVQLAAREIARDVERIADDTAVAVTGKPEPLAAAVLKLARENRARARHPRSGSVRLEALGRFSARWAEKELANRCRRLLDGGEPNVSALRLFRVTLAVAAVCALGFFVV